MEGAMAMDIDELVRKLRDLPSLPAVVVELMSSMEQQDIDVPALAARIALDQALAAKTLRLANSSFYGLQFKVISIQQAISILGFHSVRKIITACAVTGAFPKNQAGPAGFSFDNFWRHSVASAVCAQLLAPRLGVNPDTAFTAGLLHDIGTLVLAIRLPAQYEQVLAWRREHDCYPVEAEQAIFGIDHSEVGSKLLAFWNFPLAVREAVAAHHAPNPDDGPSLALALNLGSTLARALDLTGDEDDLAPPVSQAAWDLLALSEADSEPLFRQAETNFASLCQILVQ
jgi:putative nucleotidyltransferase with HDIG domain